uniref:Uncharacterized protein n=1 Tax=Lepeophtheirus salmonis TaxID=72036 RepID=A0A0K2V8E2_LEPSM
MATHYVSQVTSSCFQTPSTFHMNISSVLFVDSTPPRIWTPSPLTLFYLSPNVLHATDVVYHTVIPRVLLFSLREKCYHDIDKTV